jgi:hypothetical protein
MKTGYLDRVATKTPSSSRVEDENEDDINGKRVVSYII